jgi:hypothetical protein
MSRSGSERPSKRAISTAHDVVTAGDPGDLEAVPLQSGDDADAGDGGKRRHQAATVIDSFTLHG